ncbi:MFS transporter [candidate division KSB1 bacterium]|nr:MFS transporter [candidate division KSB1 bacterium]
MQKYLTILASFATMLCIGSVYAWSVFVPELKTVYGFSTAQTQLVFGVLTAIFPTTMIFAGRVERRIGSRALTALAALFFGSGYLLAGFSGGLFGGVLLGIGVLAGIGTGFGYLAALTTPVKWFPEKKGLVTGIAAAGFGLAAVFVAALVESWLEAGKNVLWMFSVIGIGYGLLIFFFSLFMKAPPSPPAVVKVELLKLARDSRFLKLFFAILGGTFAGLLVIGNLKPIGLQYGLDNPTLALGIAVFSTANFIGRLFWGWVSDSMRTPLSIFLALSFQAAAVFLIGYVPLSPLLYCLLAGAIGFGFGANFVLFAKETAHLYGIGNLGIVYPYVFMGYACAGILGPLTGGLLFDALGGYSAAAFLAALTSLAGALIFIIEKPAPDRTLEQL